MINLVEQINKYVNDGYNEIVKIFEMTKSTDNSTIIMINVTIAIIFVSSLFFCKFSFLPYIK